MRLSPAKEIFLVAIQRILGRMSWTKTYSAIRTRIFVVCQGSEIRSVAELHKDFADADRRQKDRYNVEYVFVHEYSSGRIEYLRGDSYRGEGSG